MKVERAGLLAVLGRCGECTGAPIWDSIIAQWHWHSNDDSATHLIMHPSPYQYNTYGPPEARAHGPCRRPQQRLSDVQDP